jgi:hypothetical protein
VAEYRHDPDERLVVQLTVGEVQDLLRQTEPVEDSDLLGGGGGGGWSSN